MNYSTITRDQAEMYMSEFSALSEYTEYYFRHESRYIEITAILDSTSDREFYVSMIYDTSAMNDSDASFNIARTHKAFDLFKNDVSECHLIQESDIIAYQLALVTRFAKQISI